jgi:hypothetical protein
MLTKAAALVAPGWDEPLRAVAAMSLSSYPTPVVTRRKAVGGRQGLG